MSTAKPHGMTESGGSPGNAVQPGAKRRARSLKRRQRRIFGGMGDNQIQTDLTRSHEYGEAARTERRLRQ